MSFTSTAFLVFVPVALVAYYLLPGRVQWLALLAASYVFYLRGNGKATVWLVGVTALTWCAALVLGPLNETRKHLPEEGKKAALARIKGQKRLVVLVEMQFHSYKNMKMKLIIILLIQEKQCKKLLIFKV